MKCLLIKSHLGARFETFQLTCDQNEGLIDQGYLAQRFPMCIDRLDNRMKSSLIRDDWMKSFCLNQPNVLAAQLIRSQIPTNQPNIQARQPANQRVHCCLMHGKVRVWTCPGAKKDQNFFLTFSLFQMWKL